MCPRAWECHSGAGNGAGTAAGTPSGVGAVSSEAGTTFPEHHSSWECHSGAGSGVGRWRPPGRGWGKVLPAPPEAQGSERWPLSSSGGEGKLRGMPGTPQPGVWDWGCPMSVKGIFPSQSCPQLCLQEERPCCARGFGVGAAPAAPGASLREQGITGPPWGGDSCNFGVLQWAGREGGRPPALWGTQEVADAVKATPLPSP